MPLPTEYSLQQRQRQTLPQLTCLLVCKMVETDALQALMGAPPLEVLCICNTFRISKGLALLDGLNNEVIERLDRRERQTLLRTRSLSVSWKTPKFVAVRLFLFSYPPLSVIHFLMSLSVIHLTYYGIVFVTNMTRYNHMLQSLTPKTPFLFSVVT